MPSGGLPRTVTLPGRREMMERLQGVSKESYLVAYLYPLILKSAGRSTHAGGVATMLLLAHADFGKDQAKESCMVVTSLLPDMIRALVDDEDVCRQALVLVNKS